MHSTTSTIAYSTNSLTSTPDDLRGMRGEGDLVIRRPRLARQRFSRLTAPASERKAADLLIQQARARRLAMVGARTVGSAPAEPLTVERLHQIAADAEARGEAYVLLG